MSNHLDAATITEEELKSFRIDPAGGPGRLDTDRVYVTYSDGCEVAFARHQSVAVVDIILHHRQAHEECIHA